MKTLSPTHYLHYLKSKPDLRKKTNSLEGNIIKLTDKQKLWQTCIQMRIKQNFHSTKQKTWSNIHPPISLKSVMPSAKKKKKLSLWAVMILIISLAVGSIRYLEKQSQAKSGLLIVAWLADVKRPWGSRGCCHHTPRPSHSTLMMPPQIVQAVGISSPSYYFFFFNLSNPGESSRLYSTVLFQANILLHCAPEHN